MVAMTLLSDDTTWELESSAVSELRIFASPVKELWRWGVAVECCARRFNLLRFGLLWW